MPKLIPELEDRIIRKAESMFVSEGFDGVSMRKLAAELDIAVGTLYNYFPNKTQLFYSIMQQSWDETFREINGLKNRLPAGPELRRKVTGTIYDDINSRGAFALKTFAPAANRQHSHKLSRHNDDWQLELLSRLESELRPTGAGFSGSDAGRIIRTLLASIRFFVTTLDSRDREGDIDFLMKIIEELH